MLNGKPAPASRLVALLSGSVEQPGDVLSFMTGPNGTFQLSGLPSGLYYLAAWQESNIPVSFLDAEFVPVTVDASQTRNIDVPIYQQKP